MKVYALTIFSTLALASPSLGTDFVSHSERHGVLPAEVQQQAIGDRRYDDNTHERVTANLRSTPHRAFEIPVEESQRNESISSKMPPQTHEAHRLMSECGDVNGQFKIDLTTDNFGHETSWRLQVLKGDTWTEVVSGPPSNSDFSGNTRYIGVQCLLPGKYKFTIFDKAKDGLCCEKGQGKYTAFVDGIMRFSSPLSSTSWAKRVHLFTIFPPPTSRPNPTQFDIGSSVQNMSSRDKEWLDSHNNKRQLWHTRHNKTFVPLSWDSSLKAESKVWAEHLLSSCGKGMWHDPNNSYGENIASNSGTGSWAARRTTDDVVARFVDREEGKLYPENLHLTQVLWRSTKYVGCAEASKEMENGGVCHTQVCRYARPGNCNMNKYMTTAKDWWLVPMLSDDSLCGPTCPSHGCH